MGTGKSDTSIKHYTTWISGKGSKLKKKKKQQQKKKKKKTTKKQQQTNKQKTDYSELTSFFATHRPDIV